MMCLRKLLRLFITCVLFPYTNLFLVLREKLTCNRLLTRYKLISISVNNASRKCTLLFLPEWLRQSISCKRHAVRWSEREVNSGFRDRFVEGSHRERSDHSDVRFASWEPANGRSCNTKQRWHSEASRYTCVEPSSFSSSSPSSPPPLFPPFLFKQLHNPG